MTEHNKPDHLDTTFSSPLPPELAEFLKRHSYAALLHATDRGTVLLIKAPAPEIESVRGPVPIEIRHELYRHPASPVIRMLTRVYDQPDRPLALETLINIDDEAQRSDYGELARQDELSLLFYDENLQHRLAKRVRNAARSQILEVLLAALRLRAQIPNECFSFETAKVEVMSKTLM